MVAGIQRFREHFAGHENDYVLIGGAACDLIFAEAGLAFRATKDFDVVLCVEATRAEFSMAFRDFIDAGGYEARQRSDGHKEYYRFYKPVDDSYPYMIELFTRRPNGFEPPAGFNIIRVPVDDGVLSLSAILLDDDYYAALHDNKVLLDGIALLDERLLIPFKAKAFLDLTARKEAGDNVAANDIKKHRNDVYRLAQLLTAETVVELPDTIRNDMRRLLQATANDASLDPHKFGVRMSREEGADLLQAVYRL